VVFVLDTDIATLAFLNQERVAARLAAQPAESVAVSQATRLEILRGRIEAVIKAADGEELMRAVTRLAESEAFLRPFPMLLIDEAAASHFDALRANKTLKKMDRGDLLHAAIALAHNATLVTRNTKTTQASRT
jgi:tRNA(fMet)-specific endonuclease VapC